MSATPAAVISGTLPSRPAPGVSGKKITVVANYWPAIEMPSINVHQYDVDITDDKGKAMPVPLNRRIFKLVVEAAENDSKFAGKAKFAVFDGRKIAFTPIKINLGSAEAFRTTVEVPEDNGNGNGNGSGNGAARPGRKFNFMIKYAAEIDITRLMKFVNGQLAAGDSAQEAVNAFDVLLRHHAATIEGCEPVGRGWYLKILYPVSGDLSGGAEAWNGLKLSMRAGQGSILLNADLATTAFLISGPAIDVVKRILNKNDMTRPLNDREIAVISKLLAKVRITLNLRRSGRHRYTVNKVGNVAVDKVTFDHEHDGVKRTITVARYFEETYNIKLVYPHLPCFIVGNMQRPTMLPFEVCNVPAGQVFKRKLDEGQTGNMIRIAQQRPADRLNRAQGGVNKLVGPVREGTNYRSNKFLEAFGVKLAKDPLTISARILDAPVISYSPKSRSKDTKPVGGAWNLKDKRLARGMTLHSWSVLVLDREQRVNRGSIDNFVKVLVNMCKTTGMEVTTATPPLRYGQDQNIETMLKASWRDAGDGCKTKPQMILVIVPDTNPRRYAEIKRCSDTVLGVITQVMQSKHVGKASPQYCANLVLKINVKLGGFNSFSPQLPFISELPTLVIGMDVTHPGPGEGNSRPSIAAMVGSLDAQCARFAATLRIQRSPQGRQRCDIIQDVFGMTTELLRAFYREAKAKPKRILVYRDGASEGQFNEIRHTEVAAIHRACHEIDKAGGGKGDYQPKVTYIVVTKRHNTRFFAKSSAEADKSGNVQPGTVVDTKITHPKEWDFFLNSHAGLLGTSRSAHYHVLHDENEFNSDKLQNMTYRLCYLYARCTRSVSVCPPIYYADLVAARARFHFQGMAWDTETSTSGSSDGTESQKALLWDEKYAKVKADLALVMYYM
ncbi:hypothetical protein HDU87_003581 [Geranomyces variabilis]|uniref:Piwi-domain-containing protein n=1 Tax=Geranomyces variabilis TaxID=109894 RepID=A0AAD5TJQ5_9FUNG|nr:hypothetical protein HDU87_003581 [Geranomyces variabilis]